MIARRLLGAALACAAAVAHAADPPPAPVAPVAPPGSAAVTPPPPYGPAIKLADARRCVAAVQAYAAQKQWYMVVTVVDGGGHQVVSERMDNAQYGSIGPALHKAQTASAFRRSTKVFEDVVAQGGAALRLLKLDGAMPIEGGLPLVVNGALVGAVGVSGGTSAQDGEAAGACVAALASR